MAELVEAFTWARRELEKQAIAIHEARPDDFGVDLRIAGPSTAVYLVIEAMFQAPDVVPAIAAYFEALAATRTEPFRCDANGCERLADLAYIGEGGDLYLCDFHGGAGEVEGWRRITNG